MTRRTARQYADALLTVLREAKPAERPRIVRGFLRELGRRRQRKLLPRILERIEARQLAASNRVKVRVLSAHPLPRGFAERLGERLGKRVLLESEVDPALVGGVRLTVGERLYDASVPSLLAALRRRFSASD